MNHQHETRVSITNARTSHSADIRKREIRYLVSMGIRTVCFVLAIVTSGPLRWVFVTGALFLPYVAVVIANASERRGVGKAQPYIADDKPALTTGRPPNPGEPPS